jgi:lipopolysaccharide transport system ATP-binding protein
MSHAVISVRGLSKRYRLGPKQPRYKTIRETIVNAVETPVRAIRSRLGGAPRTGEEDIWALRDVSFDVGPGEVLGIIGRNGAGKSTLLKILSRITEPSAGQAEIWGRVGSLLEVGTGFHPELTGRENIFLNGAILGMTKVEIQAKFDEIVSFAEVEKFIDTAVKHYSSGMHLRLAFAVAAHLEPEILLMDEVLAVGDAAFQKKCLGKMEQVAQAGRTVLFVSHNLAAVGDLCTRAIWIHDGQVAEDGDVDEVTRTYLKALTEGAVTHSNGRFGFTVHNVCLRNADGEPALQFAPGDDLTVEVWYEAAQQLTRPILSLQIQGTRGPCFVANMLLDGQQPDRLHGLGCIRCTFRAIPLLPQMYSVRLTVRTDGRESILKMLEIAAFSVVADLREYGFEGEIQWVGDSTSVVIPYVWTMPDGSQRSISLNSAQAATRDGRLSTSGNGNGQVGAKCDE